MTLIITGRKKKVGFFISLIVLEIKHAEMYFKVTLIHS